MEQKVAEVTNTPEKEIKELREKLKAAESTCSHVAKANQKLEMDLVKTVAQYKEALKDAKVWKDRQSPLFQPDACWK
jgi:hypothetical protein